MTASAVTTSPSLRRSRANHLHDAVRVGLAGGVERSEELAELADHDVGELPREGCLDRTSDQLNLFAVVGRDLAVDRTLDLGDRDLRSPRCRYPWACPNDGAYLGRSAGFGAVEVLAWHVNVLAQARVCRSFRHVAAMSFGGLISHR